MNVIILRIISIAVTGVCAVLLGLAGGIGFMYFSIIGVYPAMGLLHIWLTAGRFPDVERVSGRALLAILGSHLALIIFTLFRFDEADSGLTITYFLGCSPIDWPADLPINKHLCRVPYWVTSEWFQYGLFVPLIATWTAVWMLLRSLRKRFASNPN